MISQLSNGANYNFQLKLFRDDVNGLATMPSSAPVGIYEVGKNTLVANVVAAISSELWWPSIV